MFRKKVLKQYQDISNKTRVFIDMKVPNEGWIRTIRKSLIMTGSQLARRLGVTRAWVSRTEQAELKKAVTLKTMEDMATAMGCKFMYAFVPHKRIEEIIYEQAKNKAKHIANYTNEQMALEEQAVSKRYIELDVEDMTQDLIDKMTSKIWDVDI